MRSRTSTWFETRVRYDKTMEDGQMKKVIEQYVVDAFSFSEAEEFITEEMSVESLTSRRLLLLPMVRSFLVILIPMISGLKQNFLLLL